MLARQYSRKIDIYTTEEAADGFGGNIVTDVLIGCFWAEVKQNSSFKDNSIGNSEMKNTYSFKVRANEGLSQNINNLSIVYQGKKFVVNDARFEDENFRFINIIANN